MADVPTDETHTALAAAVADLAKSLGALDSTIGTIGKIDRRGRRNTWLGGMGLVAALAFAIVGTTSTLERNDRAEQSRTLLEAIQANQETVKACTTPGHQCYDENQARSNARLAPIIAVICKGIPEEDRATEPLCRPR